MKTRISKKLINRKSTGLFAVFFAIFISMNVASTPVFAYVADPSASEVKDSGNSTSTSASTEQSQGTKQSAEDSVNASSEGNSETAQTSESLGETGSDDGTETGTVSEETNSTSSADETLEKELLQYLTQILSEETESESEDALTPDGNLTLVDDFGNTTGTGKQFMTVVTKSGEYFYIVVDRDDNGDATVHFLNQVDDADLLSLLDDETREEYETEMEAEASLAESVGTDISQSTVEETTEVEPETEEIEAAKETSDNHGMIGVIAILVLFVIGAALIFMSLILKKKNQRKPDSDESYAYDEEDSDEFYDSLYGEDEQM